MVLVDFHTPSTNPKSVFLSYPQFLIDLHEKKYKTFDLNSFWTLIMKIMQTIFAKNDTIAFLK